MPTNLGEFGFYPLTREHKVEHNGDCQEMRRIQTDQREKMIMTTRKRVQFSAFVNSKKKEVSTLLAKSSVPHGQGFWGFVWANLENPVTSSITSICLGSYYVKDENTVRQALAGVKNLSCISVNVD